jgi:hypothetical protein
MNHQIHQSRLIVLWLLLLIGMILHFNYHVSDIFYGIDVTRPGVNGQVPWSTFYIKTIYYHLPIVFILVLLYSEHKVVKVLAFCVGLVYTASHAMHLFKEIGQKATSVQSFTQINLLIIVLVLSVLMNLESWRWMKHKAEVL